MHLCWCITKTEYNVEWKEWMIFFIIWRRVKTMNQNANFIDINTHPPCFLPSFYWPDREVRFIRVKNTYQVLYMWYQETRYQPTEERQLKLNCTLSIVERHSSMEIISAINLLCHRIVLHPWRESLQVTSCKVYKRYEDHVHTLRVVFCRY